MKEEIVTERGLQELREKYKVLKVERYPWKTELKFYKVFYEE
ncbi:MAG: hypothetical protein ACE5K0_12475 [Candidatus Methanofastidiosia archaeon]